MAIDRVVLHIGYPKTGTKALQWGLWANRRSLRDRGVHVLDAGRTVRIAQHDGFVTDEALDDAPAEIAALQDDARRWTVVASTESFSQLSSGNILIVGHRLRRIFGDTPIDAHVYLRNPLDWAQSYSFQRYLGGAFRPGELLSLNRALPEIEDRAMVAFLDVLNAARYHERMPEIRDTYRLASLHCHHYDRNQFPAGSILQDFLSHLGVDFDEGPEGGLVDAPPLVHPSLTLEAVTAAEERVRNTSDPSLWHRVVPAVRELAEDLGGQRSFLRLSSIVSLHGFIDGDTAAFVRDQPELEALRTPTFPPAGEPDRGLVDRYLELLDEQMELPILRVGTPAPVAGPGPDADVLFRIPYRDRIEFAGRIEAIVRLGDDSEHRVSPVEVPGPGSRWSVPLHELIGRTGAEAVTIELAPVDGAD